MTEQDGLSKVESPYVYADETYRILGGCFEVYKRMGCGFLESVYQECLEIEFEYLGIPFVSQAELGLAYRERPLKSRYKPDFVCYGKIVLEIKALSALTDEHRAQVLNYLNAAKQPVGLLVNFGHYPKAEHERFVI